MIFPANLAARLGVPLIALGLMASLSAVPISALAQTSTTPAPAATASIDQLAGRGSLVVQTTISGEKFNLGGNINLFKKGPLIRIDVLNVGVPGLDPTLSAVLSQVVGNGGASVVIDSRSGSVLAWSNNNRTFYQPMPRASEAGSASPQPTPTAAATAPSDPIAALLRPLAQIRDLQTFSLAIELAPKSTVAGHPASNVIVTTKRGVRNASVESYVARFAFADDLGGFPLTMRVDAQGNKNGLNGAAQLALSQLAASPIDDGIFTAPVGYTRVTSITDIFRPRR